MPDEASFQELEGLRVSRLGAVKALHAGVAAARAGLPIRDCPFAITGDITQQFLAHWWTKGWVRVTVGVENPMGIHGYEMP